MDLTQWRVVLNSSGREHDVSAPRFDEVRHAGVCSEVCFSTYPIILLLKTAMLYS